MAKKTDRTADAKKSDGAEFGQQENCSEKCNNYAVCKIDGVFDRLIKGATCPVFSPPDEDEKNEDGPESGENTAPGSENDATETGSDPTDTDETGPKDAPAVDPPKPEAAAEPRKRYIFPRKSDIPCPGCGLYETMATSTQGQIQSRRCTRAIPRCEKTFQVMGKEVKFTDCKEST